MQHVLGIGCFLRKQCFDDNFIQLHPLEFQAEPPTGDGFKYATITRHGDLSGIVLANSDRGSIWFPPASRGYQFIYMEDFSQPSYHVCRERSFGKNLLQVFPGAFSQQKIPLWILWKSMQNDFVAHTSCVPAPLAIGATNPPGSFLQGKACIRMPRQRWSLALVASPQKGCGKKLCAVQDREMIWDV